MKYFFIVSCLIAVTQAKPNTRVIGGNDAPEGKYPYQAFIKIGDFFQCGASVISPRYILTAAHCVTGQSSSDMKIHVGTTSLESDNEENIYKVFGYETHEDYQFPTFVAPINDIALIRLQKEIAFNDKIQPVKLPQKSSESAPKSAVLTGWGTTQYLGAFSKKLQSIELNLLDQEECAQKWKAYKKVTIIPEQICTLSKKGEGACNGDSGGPLVAGGVQIGIVSFGGTPCGKGIPDVFTKVYSYVDWIKAHMY